MAVSYTHLDVYKRQVYNYNNTSLSADYTDDERLERNTAMNGIVRENHPELTERCV